MQDASYYFDVEALDVDDGIGLDDWRPSEVRKSFRQPSKWRENQNEGRPKDQVGPDDLLKIKAHIAASEPDELIIKTFNLTTKVLTAIKEKRFCPVDGILDDEYKKLSAKFENMRRNHLTLTKRVELLERTLSLSESFRSSSKLVKSLILQELKEKEEKEKKRQRVKNCKGTGTKKKESTKNEQIQDIDN